MLVLQYRCSQCSSFFEYLYGVAGDGAVDCISCGSDKVERSADVPFYPNKNFCPHDKKLDMDVLKGQLSTIMSDESLRCGGCGTDGAPGKCKSGGCGSGGGCSSGGCSGGGCGSGR